MKKLLTISLSFSFASLLAGSEGVAFFESKVRPILENSCLECHSEAEKVKGGLLLDRKAGWERGGDSGTVIKPGSPDESLLIKMVRHEPDYEAMPPKSKLREAEIEVLTEWIRMGAPDPRGEAIGAELGTTATFDLEARKEWWSLQPVKRVTVPEVKNEKWPRGEVDRFLLAGLEKRGWEPADEADRATLIRRASLVLTGLAPTPGEVQDFLADEKEGAYERVVDRLMSSPHFGEAWARHWMDVVRYGESKAFEQDYWMQGAWRYRDYLIRAFNEDVPFDQFVKEAMAGDLLVKRRLDPETGNDESVAGPGWVHLADGHHGVVDLHEDEARVIDSVIGVVGVAFQGLTISCARCHDHKFDAITDGDYYSLYGIFRSSRLHYANAAESRWSVDEMEDLENSHRAVVQKTLESAHGSMNGLPELWAKVKAAGGREDLLKRWHESAEKGKEEERKELQAELQTELSDEGMRWFSFLYGKQVPRELAGLRERLMGREVSAAGGDEGVKRQWLVDGAGARDAAEGRYFVDLDDPSVIQGASGSGVVVGDVSPRVDGSVRSEDFLLDGKPVGIWVKGRGATVSLVVRNHELVGHGPTTSSLRRSVNGEEWTEIQFTTDLWKGEWAFLQVQHQGEQKRVRAPRDQAVGFNEQGWVAVTDHLPNYAEVWGRDGAVETILAGLLAGPKSGAEVEVVGALFRAGLVGPNREEAGLAEALGDLRVRRAAVPEPIFVRSLVDGSVRDEPVYVRGNHKSLRDQENPRRFLEALGGEAVTGRGSGRLEWATAVASPDNPLTARVRVNRIWSRVFGRGLVATIDDFGVMGEAPSHPELLDFLASEFMAEGWSTKAMIRRLVLSSAFRMSSVPNAEAAQADPANVFLQRMSVRRMSAEEVRDHLLLTSGELKRDLYGPSVLGYIEDLPNSRAQPAAGLLDGDGRRSVYLSVRRNFLASFLRSFDWPNASEPVGRRNVTTVPAQALAMMNHPFVHQQAEAWGKKMMAKEGELAAKISEMHWVAFSRAAEKHEVAWAVSVLEEMGGVAQEDAWVALSHLMMNRKEFLYIF